MYNFHGFRRKRRNDPTGGRISLNDNQSLLRLLDRKQLIALIRSQKGMMKLKRKRRLQLIKHRYGLTLDHPLEPLKI